MQLVFIILLLFITPLFVTCNGSNNENVQSIENKTTFVVDPKGEGDFTDIQTAINNADPGTTILVREGIYRGKIDIDRSGTSLKHIKIMNYPNEHPIIVPGREKGNSVLFNAEYVTLDGFEIYDGWDGIKLSKGNNIIRNNNIHDNMYQGILLINAGANIIENNTIDHNGAGPNDCLGWPNPGDASQKHCHAIYFSDYFCTGYSIGNIVRGNVLSNQGGSGILWNGLGAEQSGCNGHGMKNDLIEDNLFQDNQLDIAMYYGVYNAVVRNNTFINDRIPLTDATTFTFLALWGSEKNTFYENSFTSHLDNFRGIEIHNSSSNNDFYGNTWNLVSPIWVWEGNLRDDFFTNFTKISGWESNNTNKLE